MPSSELDASIVLVTRNNAELLREALRTILADSSACDRELLVVDNGSTDATRAVVEAAAAGAPFPVVLLEEPVPGHSRGRNRAIAAARGRVLLFTDDDVLVEDGWADALARPFADPAVAFVAGRTLPLWPTDPPAWVEGEQKIVLALYDYGPDSHDLGPHEYGAGANMALRAQTLRRFDPPFDPALGHQGDRRFAYEETHLIDRLRAGHRLVYAADAVVHHRVRAERMTLEWMRGAYFDRGAALFRLEALVGGAKRPDPARRLVRGLRALRLAREAKRRNDAAPRTGEATLEELEAYKRAGRQVEIAVGGLPRLTRRIRDLVA